MLIFNFLRIISLDLLMGGNKYSRPSSTKHVMVIKKCFHLEPVTAYKSITGKECQIREVDFPDAWEIPSV